MIITILINVVFVVSLIMLSFYFVTAIRYDITFINKAYMSLLIGTLPVVVNIGFKNSIATVITLLVSVTALILIAFTKFFEKEHEKEILYDCLLYDISQDDLKKFRHMSRNEQIAFLKSVITTVESAEKEESTDENGNKVITTKTVIQKVPLIENDEELAEYEPILRKKIKYGAFIMTLTENDAVVFLESLRHPDEKQQTKLKEISKNITLRNISNGYEADIKNLDMSFLREK